MLYMSEPQRAIQANRPSSRMRASSLHPSWILLPLFTAANALLSYSSLTLGMKLIIGLSSIVFPFVLVLSKMPRTGDPTPRAPGASPLAGEVSGRVLLMAGLPVFVLAIALRFLLLDQLYVWPNLDESLSGILAWDLAHAWRWKFFWTFGQAPPFLPWVLALGIRVFGLSHALLWAVPGVLSALTIPAAYIAARSFTGRSFSLLCASLFAFSFWPMYMGRLCHQGVPLPLWACLVVWALGTHLRAPKISSFRAARLGLVLGAGSLLFTGWPPLAMLVLIATTLHDLKKPDGRRSLAFLLGAFLLAISPFVFAVFTEGYGHHMRSVSAFNGYFPPGRIILTMLSYPASLLWGVLVDGEAYTSPWGGLMSPLTGALFLLGLLEALRRRREPIFLFVLGAAAVSMLPGLLSMNVEMFRVATVLPFLVFLSAVGARVFTGTLKPQLRWAVAVLLVLGVLAWDSALLVRPFLKPWFSKDGVFGALQPPRNSGFYLACRTLKDRAEQQGPGLVFTSFTPAYNDASLFTGTYGFNALMNSPVKPIPVPWAACVVNVHYALPLARRFPGASWTWLDKGKSVDDGGMMLFVIPIGEKGLNPAEAARWLRVHSVFFTTDLALHQLPDNGPFKSVLPILEKAYGDVKADPFLASLYWEKVAHVRFMDKDYEGNVAAWANALKEGLPTAHLECLLGALLLVRDGGQHGPSIALLEKAAQDPDDRTMAKALLQELQKAATR